MNASQTCKLLLTGVVACSSLADAETINWYNSPLKTNLTSTGQPMDGAFQFQLGAFADGFVPTVGNISQWASHWVAAASGNYNPTSRSFNENFTVTGNAAPFTVGVSAYVWGRGSGLARDEWILFRKSDWNWPAPNPMDPFGLAWNAASADQVILGSINTTGTPFLMRSAAIVSYAQWAAAELAGESLNEPYQDADGDGVSNLLEFVFGTPPASPNAAAATPPSLVDVGGVKYLQIRIPRRIDHPAALTVEVSADLVHWNSGAAYTAVVEDSAAALIVRDLVPCNSASPGRFMRLRATLP